MFATVQYDSVITPNGSITEILGSVQTKTKHMQLLALEECVINEAAAAAASVADEVLRMLGGNKYLIQNCCAFRALCANRRTL